MVVSDGNEQKRPATTQTKHDKNKTLFKDSVQIEKREKGV